MASPDGVMIASMKLVRRSTDSSWATSAALNSPPPACLGGTSRFVHLPPCVEANSEGDTFSVMEIDWSIIPKRIERPFDPSVSHSAEVRLHL
jgi:hypothetical protein